MKVSWVKFNEDNENFKIVENLGFDVFKINNNIDVDEKLDELIANNYKTIIVSNEVAGLSQKINSEYALNKNVDIIISNDKDRK